MLKVVKKDVLPMHSHTGKPQILANQKNYKWGKIFQKKKWTLYGSEPYSSVCIQNGTKINSVNDTSKNTYYSTNPLVQ